MRQRAWDLVCNYANAYQLAIAKVIHFRDLIRTPAIRVEDNGTIAFSWSFVDTRNVAVLEILTDGCVEWFTKSENGFCEGSEDPEPWITTHFTDFLARCFTE